MSDNSSSPKDANNEKKAKKGIVYRVDARPRAVHQVFNTRCLLQLITNFRQHHQSKEANKPLQCEEEKGNVGSTLLTVLVLLRYAHEDIFQAIVDNPFVFFYLHAVATGNANKVCKEIELEEILTVGLPEQAVEKNWFTIYRDHPRIVPIMDLLTDEIKKLDQKTLYEYIFLIGESEKEKNEHSQTLHEWEALTSGNPALIRQASSAAVGRLQEYVEQIYNELLLLSSHAWNSNNAQNALSFRIERMIFAVGRVEELIGEDIWRDTWGAYVDLLCRSLQPEEIPEFLKHRLVFALGRLCQSEPLASKKLVEALIKDNLPKSILARVASVLRFCKFDEDTSPQELANWAHSSQSELLWHNLFRAGKNPEILSTMLDCPESITEHSLQICKEAIEEMVSKGNNQAILPEKTAEALVAVCNNANSENTTLAEKAFNILTAYGSLPTKEQKEQAFRWLVEIIFQGKRFRTQAWEDLGRLQKDIPWQTEKWDQLTTWAIEASDGGIVSALTLILASQRYAREVQGILEQLLNKKTMALHKGRIEEMLESLNINNSSAGGEVK